tara:strand:+ start:1420 stop:1611 length:192 start_codon:yes stop_codon:yes gene_type:complete
MFLVELHDNIDEFQHLQQQHFVDLNIDFLRNQKKKKRKIVSFTSQFKKKQFGAKIGGKWMIYE